jgi:hypothetical protein
MERPSTKCFECGTGIVELKTGTERTRSYRGQKGFKIPDELPIPTCNNCGTQWETDELAIQLDVILEPQYQELLKGKL